MRWNRREVAGTHGCDVGDGALRRRRSPAIRLLIALTLAAACGLFGAAGAAAQDSAGEVLLFHGGTTHPSVSAGVDAITALGEANDFGVEATTDAAAFTSANLAGYRAVVVLHSSGDVLNAAQRAALQAYVQGGGGFVGIGEAANLQPGDSFISGLIGARPAAGSSDTVTQQRVEVGDRVHPATRDLPLEWGPRADAWYSWQQNPTGTVHTVARARFGATADDAVRSNTTSRPISWCRDFQGGRSFYTGMGRTAASYGEANFRTHLLGAIQWAAGMVRGGCKATISSNYQSVRLTNGAGGLANSGEAHGLTIAPNGWAITIGRAACGSDAERGARIGQASFPRTLDFGNPNVGVGCAPIHIWDPEDANGTVNSGNTRAGTLTVYGDRGNGGETNGKIETGGLGIAASPDFAQTGHVYIQYFPSFNAQNPIQAGLPDGAARRITKMGRGRVSRFTIDLETKQLSLGSEVPIFEYDSQIYSCCHRGGGMGFDSEGNLYVTTGDSNSSGGNYSGNWQSVRCPTGNPAEVSNSHCGANGISYRDARRTAGNTNDYNGKMLRFNPIESIADGQRPAVGVGSTYTLPDEESPNGPNLFDGSEGGGGKAKPEIYAMGLRNPSRLAIDPKTDTPYSAWVGPDAGSPSGTLGPSTYEVASQIPRAGNWGWPYCMGNKQAYRDRLPNDAERTTNASGYVSGGPAGNPTQGWYDCDNIVNDSTNNTGLQAFPHETGTGADAGEVSPANLWYSRGNPGGNGCPVFPRDNGAGSAPNYSGQNTQLCPYYDGLGGHTVMAGPVYRYDDDATGNAGRWPAYWDGRWFVHDFSGGNNKSFGFTFDEETAAAGGQPSYVDKMAPFVSWSGGNYMDSKYGPDGALYVLTYNGSYFEHGNNDGLHRITYTGGPDTPGPDPQWQAAGDAVAFSIGKSGGVAYEWDFGDGSEPSDERSPTHTYAEAGEYDAKLTVTYADGETASKTIEVIASDDGAAPVTTASLNPAQPGPGGTYDDDVAITLSATDGTGDATGVELTERRVNGGTWTESANTEDDEPFVTTFTVDDEGEHLVEFRSRDAAGNIEATKSVAFSIDRPASGCNPLSDQFNGSEIDDKWELINPHATARPAVGGGQLTLPLVQGDLYTTNGSAQALLQPAPSGSWVATAKIAHANINANGEAAGLGLVNRFSPNHFVKTAIQYKSDADPNTPGSQPGKWAERVLTSNGASVILAPETVAWPNSGALNLTGEYAWIRFVHDAAANTITTWTSTNGTTFVQFGVPVPIDPYLAQPGGLRLGLFGKHDGSANDEVKVDAFNVVSGTTDAQTPSDDCGGSGACPQTDEFDGTTLGSKWEIRNPNPSGLSVGNGHLTLNTAQGDVSGTAFNAQNILLQDVPDGQWSTTVKLDHRAIAVNGQAAGLVIYGQDNPNYFAKTAIQWKNDWNGQPVNGFWAERILTTNGARNGQYGGEFPNSGKLTPSGDYVWLRATYDGTMVSTEYSLDGETWAQSADPFPASVLGANGVTKVGLFVKHDGGNPTANVRFDSFVVEGETCGEGGDTTPPTTTHVLDPAQPGAGGWYTSPVEVSLDATDNEGGSGVEKTEYRFAGAAAWTAYDDPITVDEDGERTIEYRSTDADGNVENIRRVTLKVDATDPATTAKINGAAPAEQYEEAVEVDLDADDGAGSGIKVTEVRVDGGEWQPYVEEETILNSAQDLQAWEQAGPGGLTWMAQDGGFARTNGGLGMPWYPKEYGDFSLKLQWRDSSSGTNGNGGLFARFPHPDETVARPAGERYPCQVGSATSSPAWVAIFCGHEIQINDHQGDAQKTGSIYNFEPLNEAQAKVQPRGTWVDYELRVVGQTYTIIRNGEVLQEWENAPDQNSSRAGDPPTNARQFARGYIGLQNHGGSDVIDYRNIRVLSLDAGTVRGPITVDGDGDHTVEYRSTDVAGNEEAVKQVEFTIGGADETAPTTEHALAGDGPVEVTLSATDPEPGAPENHDVDAEPATWAPSTVTAKSGDKVTWNFPLTANTVHDVWLYEPGAPAGDPGTEVTEPVEPGGEPVSFTFDEGGTWTYLCKVHGLRNAEGEFSGMFGTVDVAPGTATGVASTEYRVNTGGVEGEWVEAENDGGDDPFETTFTVADLGEHVVEYRSTDVAGNVETTKSVDFSIAEPNSAPTVQVSANPIAGVAPLAVQFQSVATDPDGDQLTTTWEFGDGGSATGAAPVHTYLQPGTYTARVTATDPSGATGSATVQVTVQGATGPSGNPPGDGGNAANRPGLKAPKKAKARQVKRRGLRVEVTCTVDCRAGAVLRLSGKQIGKAKALKVGADGKRTLVIKLDRKGRRKLQAALSRPGVKSKKATVLITVTSADGTRTMRGTVKLTG
jgi:PKD repeat protein/type 1 glutamine amidotransferase